MHKCKYIVSSCQRYCIFEYSNGLFGILLKKDEGIVTVDRVFHTLKDAKEVGEEFIGISKIVEELENENCEQLSLF